MKEKLLFKRERKENKRDEWLYLKKFIKEILFPIMLQSHLFSSPLFIYINNNIEGIQKENKNDNISKIVTRSVKQAIFLPNKP